MNIRKSWKRYVKHLFEIKIVIPKITIPKIAKRIFFWGVAFILALILFLALFEKEKTFPEIVQNVTITAYYTPKLGQKQYIKGSFSLDRILNGTGITYLEEKALPGIAAADPDYYPFNTILFVPGYGLVRVGDVGQAIQGPNRIDIHMGEGEDGLKKARKWGVQKTNVFVMFWGV